MKKAIALLLVLGATFGALLIGPLLGGEGHPLALGLALLLVGGYILGRLFARFELPQVSGYMVAGLLLGPYVLGLLPARQVADLNLVSEFALALIALAAGGELELRTLAQRRRTVGTLLVMRLLLVSGGITALLVAAAPFFPFLAALDPTRLWVAAVTVGVLSFATSPSTLMAVIAETRACGPFTAVALGTTVAIDVLVVLLFAATVSFGQVAVHPEAGLDLAVVARVGGQVAASFVLGGVLAAILHLYLRYVGKEIALVILAVGFFVARLTGPVSEELSHVLGSAVHLEPLLICLAAGFALRNFSPQGSHLVESLDRSALPIYVAFFALTGAALDLQTIADYWPLALFIVGIRFFWLQVSGMAAGRLSGDPPLFGRWYGPGLSAQAGVSLGLAEVLRSRFPEMGTTLAPICVAVIVINQLVGPILLKMAISRTKEGGRMWEERGE